MRSVRSIIIKGKYLKIKNYYFPIVGKVDGRLIFKFNDQYYGYRNISNDNIVMELPDTYKMVSYEETDLGCWYIDKDDGVWFVKLDPEWLGKAYFINDECHLVFGNFIEVIDL